MMMIKGSSVYDINFLFNILILVQNQNLQFTLLDLLNTIIFSLDYQ